MSNANRMHERPPIGSSSGTTTRRKSLSTAAYPVQATPWFCGSSPGPEGEGRGSPGRVEERQVRLEETFDRIKRAVAEYDAKALKVKLGCLMFMTTDMPPRAPWGRPSG